MCYDIIINGNISIAKNYLDCNNRMVFYVMDVYNTTLFQSHCPGAPRWLTGRILERPGFDFSSGHLPRVIPLSLVSGLSTLPKTNSPKNYCPNRTLNQTGVRLNKKKKSPGLNMFHFYISSGLGLFSRYLFIFIFYYVREHITFL